MYILTLIVGAVIGFWIDGLVNKKQGKLDPYDPEAQAETQRILKSLK